MNKEDILSYGKAKGMEFELAKFFSQNVCIPKGANRHPYADVLHEWIENTTQYLESKQSQSDKGFYKVYLFGGAEYRIKPSEPVYEWQWYKIIDRQVVAYSNQNDFMTEDEAPESWNKFDETKRVRQ